MKTVAFLGIFQLQVHGGSLVGGFPGKSSDSPNG